MKPCASAGRQCPREAVMTARIPGVGDRPLCLACHDTYVAMGMELRVLDPNQFVPAWRQRSLARDMTATEPAR